MGKSCSICNEVLIGEYIENFWGDTYHLYHESLVPLCFNCQRPISKFTTNGGVEYSDRRTVCNGCHVTAIKTKSQAKLILQRVKKQLKEFGFNLGREPIVLSLKSVNDIGHPDVSGRTLTTVTMVSDRIVEKSSTQIDILYALPREYFATVLAHELGHVWMSRFQFPDLPNYVSEGICELIAYLWLTSRGNRPQVKHQIFLMKVRNDAVYGFGFKLALKNVGKMGLHPTLDYVKRQKRFPVSNL